MTVPSIEAPRIEVRGVALRFSTGRQALAGAALEVRAGELVVLLGANGCGKSTMLRCIAGMLRPDRGMISVAGRAIGGLAGGALRDSRVALGMIFQQPCLVKRRSVVANVLTGTLGRHRGLATSVGLLPLGELPHALACLDAVGLAAFAAQRAGTLSGGQAQRVSVARALAQRPLALLADEPVASLDPEAADELMQVLRRVAHSDGLGVLCVLHQPELARRYADRVIGMQEGRMVFDTPPARLSEREIASLYEREAPPRLERQAA